MDKNTKNLYVFLIYIGLCLAVIMAFQHCRENGFVSDDDLYILKNTSVQNGISSESFKWAFTTTAASNWHPLTWLSHMLDCQLFKLKPTGHHIVNMVFHIANTLLLFWILRKLTNNLWPAAIAAAFFALHPLRVESVAWIAERKDVLSGFFFMITLAAYICYTEKPHVYRFILAPPLFWAI